MFPPETDKYIHKKQCNTQYRCCYTDIQAIDIQNHFRHSGSGAVGRQYIGWKYTQQDPKHNYNYENQYSFARHSGTSFTAESNNGERMRIM